MNTAPKSAIKPFLNNVEFQNMVAVTLSLKQNIYSEQLDTIIAQKNLRHFLNLLNKKIYGNAFKRYGKRIEVIAVLETSVSDRLHYHLAINNPKPDEPFYFNFLVEHLWRQTRWGYNENHIVHEANSGWVDYITKLNPKDEVDWENCHIDC